MHYKTPTSARTYLTLFSLYSKIVPRVLHQATVFLGVRIFSIIAPKYEELIISNLKIITGHNDIVNLRKLARKTFENYGRYMLDYVRLDYITKKNLKNYFREFVGKEYLDMALSTGKGAIITTPHMGNWELGGLALSLLGYKLNVLSIKDQDDLLISFREKWRDRRNINTIYIEPSNYTSLIEATKKLYKGELLAVLGDRYVYGRSFKVKFFARDVSFPAGPAYIAWLSGAPLIPCFVVRVEKDRYSGIMEKPIYVVPDKGRDREEIIWEAIQKIAYNFETVIRRYPDQWYNFYPYWR